MMYLRKKVVRPLETKERSQNAITLLIRNNKGTGQKGEEWNRLHRNHR